MNLINEFPDMQLILVALGDLFFRSTLFVLLVVFQMKTLSKRTSFLLLGSVVALYFLVLDYRALALSVSDRSVLSFYVDFLNGWFTFYIVWSLAVISSLASQFFKKS